MYDLAFETIGNATLICYDKVPVLITDPWINGSPYFGSWQHSHEIPKNQLEAINLSKYCWFSHGHPDHLNFESLHLIKNKQILLPDHYGKRIFNDLSHQKFNVKILKDRKWYRLSKRIQVLCISHYTQDALLIVRIGDKLILNFNDCPMFDAFGKKYISKIIKRCSTSFLLKLTGYGDADMINYFDQENNFIPMAPISQKKPIGFRISKMIDELGINYFIPFSSMHRYQRSDSKWANQYATGLQDYQIGFKSENNEILPAFTRYDCINDKIKEINPRKQLLNNIPPERFNDYWSEELNQNDYIKVKNYFTKVKHLYKFLDFINIRVGGKDYMISLKNNYFKRGLQFEVPRFSLMQAIDNRTFDDLLIGNFMKTTLYGKWPESKLYPDFTPYVSKFSDNGYANTERELKKYYNAYNLRWPLLYLTRSLAVMSKNSIRNFIPKNSKLYNFSRNTYYFIKEAKTKI